MELRPEAPAHVRGVRPPYPTSLPSPGAVCGTERGRGQMSYDVGNLPLQSPTPWRFIPSLPRRSVPSSRSCRVVRSSSAAVTKAKPSNQPNINRDNTCYCFRCRRHAQEQRSKSWTYIGLAGLDRNPSMGLRSKNPQLLACHFPGFGCTRVTFL
jgi:hypothetical protein